MKHLSAKYTAAFLLAGGLMMGGCTKDFNDLNTPPTSVTNIDPGILLSKVEKDAAFGEGSETINIHVGSWIQYWAGGAVAPTSRYFQVSKTDNLLWAAHYTLLRNLGQIRFQELKGMEDNPQGRTKLAIARILEISVWQRLTDLYGDVPFSQTTESAGAVNNKPKYDKQQDIYKQLIADLDAAIGKLNGGDASYGNADFYYKGAVDSWKKLGNSLKLRLGMRIRYADPVLAEKTVREAMAQPLLSDNKDNAAVPTFNNAQTTNANPVLQQILTGSPDLRYLASALVKTLTDKNDPRLTMIAAPTINSQKAGTLEYKGIGVALTDEQLSGVIKDNFSTASMTTWFNQNLAAPIPAYMFTYAEVCFFQAEAALKGWGAAPADAEGFYQKGIRAAMAQQPYNITVVPQAYIDKEFSLAGLTEEQQLEKILTQKWLMLFGRDYEAYAEWRRTGYPKLTPGDNKGSTNGAIPRRAGYSTQEALLNTDNYNEAVSRMPEKDSYLSRVWWDQKK